MCEFKYYIRNMQTVRDVKFLGPRKDFAARSGCQTDQFDFEKTELYKKKEKKKKLCHH